MNRQQVLSASVFFSTLELIVSFSLTSMVYAGPTLDPPPAQPTNIGDPVGSVSQSKTDQIHWDCSVEYEGECIEPNDMINAFEGWNLAYHGYQRSPILFDPRELNVRKRQYPELRKAPPEAAGQENLDKDNPGLGDIIDVSADDEILKTKMAIYQPISDMQQSFAKDEKARDDHLNLFSSIRGIAVLTLSYLDKTVAAGLATVQQQADSDTTNHILKQISWTSSQLANPHRNQLYIDVDEKVEACMAIVPGHEMEKGRFADFTQEKCKKQCMPKEEGGAAGSSKKGNPGDYHYCVCCAQVVESVNASVDSESVDITKPKTTEWSLLERVIWGVKIPDASKGGANNNKQEKIDFIKTYISMFRTLYGDVVFKPVNEDPTANNTDPSKQGIKFVYIYPSFSIPELIEQLRVGPYLYHDKKTETCQEYSGPPQEGVIYCPITMGKMKWGICPSVRYLVDSKKWPLLGPSGSTQNVPPFPLTKPKSEYSTDELNALLQVWVEASLGIMLSAQDIENIKLMGKTDPGRMARWIDAFCDASAVAAFQKLHARMTSIMLDHMTMNEKATDQDKDRIRRLMDRTAEYLKLALIDVRSGDEAGKFVIGASVNKDRELIKQGQLSQAAMANSHALNQRIQDFQFFGLGPSHIFNFLDPNL